LSIGDSTDFLLLSARGVPASSIVSHEPCIAEYAAMNVLEVNPLLLMGMIRLRRHDEGSEVVTLMGNQAWGNGKGLGVHNRADQLEWMKTRNENG
jgi:hypothetical protein